MAGANLKTSTHQYELLVSLMSEKPDIAKNYTKRPLEGVAAFWDEVTTQLNAMGPRQRDASGWKKVWSDYKTYIKKKLTANKNENTGTGGGPYKQKTFTPLEESVIALIGIDSSVEGIGAISFGNPSQEQQREGQQPSSSFANSRRPHSSSISENEENYDGAAPTSKRRRPALSTNRLLQEQVQNQKDFFNEMRTSMTEFTHHNAEMRRIANRKLEIKEMILDLKISKPF